MDRRLEGGTRLVQNHVHALRPRPTAHPIGTDVMLEAAALRRSSPTGLRLLDGISLELDAGERLALSGPSGAGKTLLLRALVLLDGAVDGEVSWKGIRPQGDAIPAFRRRVLYLQQTPALSEKTVAVQLAEPWSFRSSGPEAFDLGSAQGLLNAVDRPDSLLEREGSDLSGGEAQLVALLRALLLNPTVLLLDEPTSAMDEDSRGAAEHLLERWIEEDRERAWIWVSHDARQRDRMCGRHLEMESGRIRQ